VKLNVRWGGDKYDYTNAGAAIDRHGKIQGTTGDAGGGLVCVAC
jgi:hypothetical protein